MAEGDERSESFLETTGAWWRDILVAIRYLTIFPAPLDPEPEDRHFARSRRAFPVAGLAIGIAGVIVYGIAFGLELGGFVAALLAFGAVAVLSGGRGEIGLARFVDGLLAGENAEARRIAMREAHSGYAGMAAVFFSILIRAGLLAAAVAQGGSAAVLVAAILGSRAVLPQMTTSFRCATEDDRLGGLALANGESQVWMASVVGGLLVLVFLFSFSGIFAILLGTAAAFGTGLLATRLAGGLNTPGLMAIQQAAEIGLLIGAVARL